LIIFFFTFQSIKQQHSQTDFSAAKCNCEEKFNKKLKDYQHKVEKEHEANTDKALKELSDRVSIIISSYQYHC
jgi:hypothetical protein